MSRERALDLIAQKYRTLDIRAGVHVAHPRLHDVDAEIVFSRVIKVVAHIQGYVFVNLVLKPGEQFMPLVFYGRIVRCLCTSRACATASTHIASAIGKAVLDPKPQEIFYYFDIAAERQRMNLVSPPANPKSRRIRL